MTFSIPMSDLQSLYEDVSSEMLNQFGATFNIYYPPTRRECDNCVLANFGNTGSSNVYKAGGPQSFTMGLCPLCEGRGYKDVDVTPDAIKLRYYADKRVWKKYADAIAVPDAEGMIIGNMTDMPKLLRSSKIEKTDLANYRTYFFVLASEPDRWGFGEKYFYALIKRDNK